VESSRQANFCSFFEKVGANEVDFIENFSLSFKNVRCLIEFWENVEKYDCLQFS